MPKLAAIEWNENEVRLAVANVRGGDIVIDRAESVTFASSESGKPTDEQMRQQIVDLVAACKATRAETIVVVDRTGVEVRMLTVPQAPDDELPDMVRFQAQQHFSTFHDDWPLDFQPIRTPDETACTVLAATILPQRIDEIRQVCEAADLRLQGIVTRPCAMASLAFALEPTSATKCQLMVNVLGDDADLAVLQGNTVFLTRTVRLSTDWQSDVSVSIPNEIRRTLAAVQTQSMGQRIEEIVLCGSAPDDETLRSAIESQVRLPVTLLHPLDRFRLSTEVRRNVPERSERFAPLLGVLLCEVQQPRQIVDFQRPRRPAEPANRRPLWYALAVSAACILLLTSGATWWKMVEKDREIKGLQASSLALDKRVEAAQRQKVTAEEIDRWYADSANWLVELRELSERLPPAERLRVEQFQAEHVREGGRISLKGYVDESATVTELETSLRDTRHKVTGMDRDRDDSDPKYPWYFDERIQIVSLEDDEGQIDPTAPSSRDSEGAEQ